MCELQLATEFEATDCSWSAIIEAIRRHALTQPAETAEELNNWADLLQAARLVREDG